MASNQVEVTFGADSRAVVKAFQDGIKQSQKLQQATNATAKTMLALERSSRQASMAGTKGFGEMSNMLLAADLKARALAAAIDIVKRSIGGAMDMNRKFMSDIDNTARKRAEETLKLQIQGGLTPAQVRGQIPMIEQELLRTPSADVTGGIRLQTQLASSGFKEEDVKSGAALRAALEAKAASNQFGKDFGDEAEMVKNISMFVKGNGAKEPSAEDITRVSRKAVELFEKTDLQFPMLGQLAEHAATLRQFGVTENEQLAAYATLVDVEDPSEAATGMRNFVSRLGTAKGDKEKEKALRKMGMKPEDFQEGTLTEKLRKFQGGLSKLKTADQNQVLQDIFGDRAKATASLLSDTGKFDLIEQRMKQLENPTAFKKNVREFQQSRYARQQRPKIRSEIAEREADENTGTFTWGEARDVQDMMYKEEMKRAKGAYERNATTMRHYIGQGITYFGEGLGFAPEDYGIIPGDKDRRTAEEANADDNEHIKEMMERDEARRSARGGAAGEESKESAEVSDLTAALKENNRLLRENNSALDDSTAVVSGSGNRRKPPLASEQLDRRRYA